MNIRPSFAILLLLIQMFPFGAGASYFANGSDGGKASCVCFQVEQTGNDLGGDCSSACKDGLPCSDCGTTCCAQSLIVSSLSLAPGALGNFQTFPDFDSPLAPYLAGINEPPRA